MNTVDVGNIKIGAGIPKICVPITEKTYENIINMAHKIKTMPLDIVEWRIDYFEDSFNIEAIHQILLELKNILLEIPLLFTYRTLREGGKKNIDLVQYMHVNEYVTTHKLVDMIDIELFTGDFEINRIINIAQQTNVKVIISNHDFDKTPSKQEIINRLCSMQNLGANIGKIAVMPNKKSDVFTLLDAANEMNEQYANIPIIAISMGKYGVISRLCGELFGSAITFGTIDNTSTIGQIHVKDLHSILNILHT